MSGREVWLSAVARAEAGAEAWRAAAVAQRVAAPDHGEFYVLAGALVDTLRAVEELARVLERQVAGYATGRRVFDDAGQDPRARLVVAGAALMRLRGDLRRAERAANEFWSAIGHIGVDLDDTGENQDDGPDVADEPAGGEAP